MRRTTFSSALGVLIALGTGLGLSAAEKPQLLGFDRLASFACVQEPDSRAAVQASVGIPLEIRALDGQIARVKGFMLPLRLEGGKAMEFLLLKDQNACCYGRMPRLYEWVLIKAKPGVPILMDVPIVCVGRLSVGERMESGAVTGIYFMDSASLGTNQ